MRVESISKGHVAINYFIAEDHFYPVLESVCKNWEMKMTLFWFKMAAEHICDKSEEPRRARVRLLEIPLRP